MGFAREINRSLTPFRKLPRMRTSIRSGSLRDLLSSFHESVHVTDQRFADCTVSSWTVIRKCYSGVSRAKWHGVNPSTLSLPIFPKGKKPCFPQYRVEPLPFCGGKVEHAIYVRDLLFAHPQLTDCRQGRAVCEVQRTPQLHVETLQLIHTVGAPGGRQMRLDSVRALGKSEKSRKPDVLVKAVD